MNQKRFQKSKPDLAFCQISVIVVPASRSSVLRCSMSSRTCALDYYARDLRTDFLILLESLLAISFVKVVFAKEGSCNPIFSEIEGSSEWSISYPQQFLPSSLDTFMVVPEPRNGSSTVSPTYVNSLIILLGISSGKAAIPSSTLP